MSRAGVLCYSGPANQRTQQAMSQASEQYRLRGMPLVGSDGARPLGTRPCATRGAAACTTQRSGIQTSHPTHSFYDPRLCPRSRGTQKGSNAWGVTSAQPSCALALRDSQPSTQDLLLVPEDSKLSINKQTTFVVVCG